MWIQMTHAGQMTIGKTHPGLASVTQSGQIWAQLLKYSFLVFSRNCFLKKYFWPVGNARLKKSRVLS